MNHDTLITGGTLLDGSGTPAQRADIAINNGRITRIGDLAGAMAATTIDATGQGASVRMPFG